MIRYLFVRSSLESFFLFVATALFSVTALAGDPYASMSITRLPNGLDIVLAPNTLAKTVYVEIDVFAGSGAEDYEKPGVAHLLEHYLFHGNELNSDSSYLDVIQERGGQTNAVTSRDQTYYFATMEPRHLDWLVNLYYRMVSGRTFSDEKLPKIKNSVLLEIGSVPPLDEIMQRNPLDHFIARHLPIPDFWNTEFGVDFNYPPRAIERHSTLMLKAHDVETFYKSYYHPKNMMILVAGSFDRDHIGQLIQKTFGTMTGEGKIFPEPDARPREAPYSHTSLARQSPSIALGTKVWNLSNEDEITIGIYLEYLAHRLMKELRNSKGQTYTAYPDVAMIKNYGHAAVAFEAPREVYYDNLNYVEDLIHRETNETGLTADQYKEAVELYLRRMNLSDVDSSSLAALAHELYNRQRVYHARSTPYEVVSRLTLADFNQRLKKIFDPRHAYKALAEPPLVSTLDTLFLSFFALIVMLALCKLFFTGPFDHMALRWMRKIQFPGPLIIETAVVLAATLAMKIPDRLVQIAFAWSPWLQSSLYLSEYFKTIVVVAMAVIFWVGSLMLVPRKLIVVGDELYVKSISLRSRRLRLKDIVAVEAVSPFEVLLHDMRRVSWRFFYFHPLLWRRGLLVRLKDGRAWYFSISEPDQSRDELLELTELARPKAPNHAIA